MLETNQQQTTNNTTNFTTILDPLGDSISSLELIRVSGSDVDIVNAARVSYGKYVNEITERDHKLIQFLMNHGHTSPFEHNQLSFRVKTPLYVSKQWMRHRMNSYNEISYRYVQAKVEFYIPVKWRFQDKANKQASTGAFEDEQSRENYKKVIELAFATYEQMLAAGICREQARGVLPTCTYTQFIFTCNLHSLMHFLKLRLHEGAQYEIRMYALGMLKLALPHFPVAFDAWQKKNMPDGLSEYDLIRFNNE
jgi:thymidylate synthase (FAD)